MKLTDLEKNIFSTLLAKAKQHAPNTTLRAAGGWLRDKLLEIDSHDIDIAVDNISGQEFVKLMTSHFTVIKSNPDQSKHLETTMATIFGVPIDFVQFRKEVYEDSRIPTITTDNVTPAEDASRRDFTINALFYNLHTEEIEDHCGGLEDLKNKTLRTPLDPKKTFLDDPLRILRGIRFAAKYNLSIDPAMIEAANHPEVQTAFKTKISQERIWREMVGVYEVDGFKRGFLLGPNPVLACRLMKDMGIRDLLFTLTDEEKKLLGVKQDETAHWDQDQNSKYHNLTVWEHTLAAMGHLVRFAKEDDIDKDHPQPENEEIVRILSVLFHDIGKCDLCYRQLKDDGTFGYHGHAESSAKTVEYLLDARLKAPKDIITRVEAMAFHHMRIHIIEDKPSKTVLRRILKDIGDDWKNLVYHSLADNMGKIGAEEDKKYKAMIPTFEMLKNENGGGTKPKRPIDGHVIMTELNLKPGPLVKVVTNALDEALLENPNMTSDEAIAFIKTVTVQ